MTDKIRWGILSTAGINRALIGPLQQSERSELMAVASCDLDRAQDYAAEKNIPKAYGDYQDLLDDPQIDAIYNPLPNSLHCEWSVRAARAGKHVLCEKPLVMNLEEMDAVEEAAASNRVIIFEAFANLHHPQTQRVRELVQSDRIGRLKVIQGWMGFSLQDPDNIRFDPELGGGSLWDLGVYPNSLAIVLTGSDCPQEVWATQEIGETGVDLSTMAQLRFRNGAVAQICSSFRFPRYRGLIIVGSRGGLYLDEPTVPPDRAQQETRLIHTAVDGSREILSVRPYNAYLAEVQAMEACLLDGAEPVVPLSLSRQFLRSVLAINESARTGKVIYPAVGESVRPGSCK